MKLKLWQKEKREDQHKGKVKENKDENE